MNQKKLLSLLDEVLEKATEINISEVLPKALTLAKLLDDTDFEKWILLEASGYYNTNSALTNGVLVPKYRKVPGQYYDKLNSPLIIDDPDLFQIISNYPLRDSVAELEAIEKKEGFLSFRNPTVMRMINKKVGVQVDTFRYSTSSVKGVLNEIRNYLISWILEKQKEIAENAKCMDININFPIELSNLHPIVQKTAGELFQNGHYRQAVLDTYIALVEAVKVKSGRYDLDNTPLMQIVFSPKNPVITFSNDPDEQLGFMWLFSGAVMGIRNPKAHRLIDQNDPQRTIEWLSFASVLLRVLDDSKLNPI